MWSILGATWLPLGPPLIRMHCFYLVDRLQNSESIQVSKRSSDLLLTWVFTVITFGGSCQGCLTLPRVQGTIVHMKSQRGSQWGWPTWELWRGGWGVAVHSWKFLSVVIKEHLLRTRCLSGLPSAFSASPSLQLAGLRFPGGPPGGAL